VRFLYLVTLEMPWDKQDFPRTRVDEKLPIVPGPDEIRSLFAHVTGIKNRAVLMVCFGAGLRISEAVALKIAHIDSQRVLLRIEHGKGGKDRYTTLSPALLQLLRACFRIVRPAGEWMFPSWRAHRHIGAGLVQRACQDAWQRAGLPSPAACSKTASIRASSRSCSAIATSIPPPAIPPSLPLKSPPPIKEPASRGLVH
jgi:integrase